MVAHHELSATVINHPADHFWNLRVFLSAVGEVDDDDRSSLWVAKGAAAFGLVTKRLSRSVSCDAQP